MLDGPGTSEYCEAARLEGIHCATGTSGVDKVYGGSRNSATCFKGGVALA